MDMRKRDIVSRLESIGTTADNSELTTWTMTWQQMKQQRMNINWLSFKTRLQLTWVRQA
jgi:hypothetical protein